jgi:hypothetical protein
METDFSINAQGYIVTNVKDSDGGGTGFVGFIWNVRQMEMALSVNAPLAELW